MEHRQNAGAVKRFLVWSAQVRISLAVSPRQRVQTCHPLARFSLTLQALQPLKLKEKQIGWFSSVMACCPINSEGIHTTEREDADVP